MSQFKSLFLASLLALATFFWYSCSKKEDSTPVKTAPVLEATTAAGSITDSSAATGGNITSSGGGTISARGVCWNKTGSPTTADKITTDGTGAGSFSSVITKLEANTKYYVRSYAISESGTGYGAEINFTTSAPPANLPTVSVTADASAISSTTAISGGTVDSDGGSAVTARGVCWNTTGNPTVSLSTKTTNGTGTGSFTSNLTGLTATTQYKARAYATNANGTAYGPEVTFTTAAGAPTAPIVGSTTAVSDITSLSAKSGGNITSDGGSPVTNRGICWSTTGTNPTIALTTKTFDGSGTGSFTSNITDLSTSTAYFVRAYATNSIGTSYGPQLTFTTPALFTPGAGVTDVDGNSYQTVIIGTQEWMKENLKVSKFRNGNLIPTNFSNSDWAGPPYTDPKCAIYENSGSNNATYGKLYNWFCVVDSRGLCPAGWHSPSAAEWQVLIEACGGQSYAGEKLKSTSSLWTSGNLATNEAGFSGLPGGRRALDGPYDYIGGFGLFWTTNEYGSSGNDAGYKELYYGSKTIGSEGFDKRHGLSVRCIKN